MKYRSDTREESVKMNHDTEKKITMPLIGFNRSGSEVRLAEEGDRFNDFTVVSGKSGSGKTTFCLNLAAEYADLGKNVIMLDGHNGLDADKLPLKLKKGMEKSVTSINVSTDIFTLPLWTDLSRNGTEKSERDACRRLRDALAYAVNMNSKEKNAILKILELMADEGLYIENGLSAILEILEDMEKAELLSVKDKLYPLLQDVQIKDGSFFASDPGLYRIDFNDLNYDAQTQLIEFFLYIFYEIACTGCFKKDGIIIFLDEAQMARYDKNSVLHRMIQEGRKLGLGLIISTPVVSNKHKTGMEILLDCATQIYFSPGGEINKIAQRIDKQEEIRWTYLLKRLEKGEFVGCGRFLINQKVSDEPQRLRSLFDTEKQEPQKQ